jgi:PAS domain-containing protein
MGAGTRDMADTALHNFTSVDAAAILENVTDGMGLFEANGDIALWNGAMFAINGFPRQLFTGFRNISQAFHWQFENGHLERSHPSVEADVAAFMTRFLSGERYVVTHHLRPNGRWVHVTWRTLPDGRRLLVHRDVTELKQRELELEEARDAIERERATKQAILDNMTDGVALLASDGDFLTVNKAFRALNEIPDDQFMPMRNLRDTYRWQATQRHVPMFGATLDEHAEHNMRRFVVADGSPSILRRPSDRWVEGRYLALPDGRRLNVNRDVTELKERELELEQAHAAAERQRELIQSIIDNLPDAVVLCEANGDIAQWNEAVYSLNGFPRHGFRNIADAFRWQTEHHQISQDAQGVEELVANLMRMFLSSQPYRVTRRRPNGNWVESIWKSLPDGRRMIIGRDVTELKEHEQELARERELMQTMLDNMGDGVVLAQPSGEWILVNKPLYRINGWPKNVHSNSCSYDDVRWLLENGHLERKLPTLDADIERIRLRFVDADGTPKDFRRINGTRVEVRWIKLPDERRLGMYRDITALKQQEQRIAEERDAAEAARAEAEAANNAKSTFLATMSHEIRTPMNGVLGMMEVLEHQGLDDAQRATVATMRESAVALLRIIDDVLDFSKIEAGRMELEETAFSLSELVTSTVQTFRPQAAAKHLRVGATIEPASADALIGDPVRSATR